MDSVRPDANDDGAEGADDDVADDADDDAIDDDDADDESHPNDQALELDHLGPCCY